uniref:Uncharacterized protein n=1 Tax=Ditylenchus dipsaci TaxID=166011 RepID=A0A915E218_9BILA
MTSRQKRYSQYTGRSPAPKEVRFDPPWMHRIGQLQNAVEVLRQYSGVHLKNKNSLIVRCFAQSSAVYMELVFSLINTVLSELDPNQPPPEVEPILISQHAVKYLQPLDIQKCKADKVEWTDTVLIRVPFKADYTARLFQVKFNRLVPEVFDKISVRTPFAHLDCTRPERDLRFRLQAFCREKNVAARSFQMAAKRDGFEWTGVEQYFHNGVQLFKKSYFHITALKLQPDSEIQHLHSIVASLKKYSQLYQDKKLSAIIQNFPRPTLMTKEMDMEQLNAAVYRVVLTNEFQEKCPGVNNFEITRVMRNPEAAITPTSKSGTKSGGSTTIGQGALCKC